MIKKTNFVSEFFIIKSVFIMIFTADLRLMFYIKMKCQTIWKVLLQYNFTENHGAIETKTYQQNCCLKMLSFKGPRKGNIKQMCGWKIRPSREYGVNMGEKLWKNCLLRWRTLLTHFQAMFHFYIPLKTSGGVEMEHWLKLG